MDEDLKDRRVDTSEKEIEDLLAEIEKLKKQNQELKRALLSSLDSRIYSLLGLCGFSKRHCREGEDECDSE